MANVEIDALTLVDRDDATDGSSFVPVKDTTRAASDSTVRIPIEDFETLETKVSQTAHGFSVGDIIKSSGTDNDYTEAQADSAANAEAVGQVTVVDDVDNFRFQHVEGTIITAGVPVATAGTVYYLDQSTAGAVTSTKPSSGILKTLFIVLESGAKAAWLNRPAEDLDAGGGGGGGTLVALPWDDNGTTLSSSVNNSQNYYYRKVDAQFDRCGFQVAVPSSFTVLEEAIIILDQDANTNGTFTFKFQVKAETEDPETGGSIETRTETNYNPRSGNFQQIHHEDVSDLLSTLAAGDTITGGVSKDDTGTAAITVHALLLRWS